MLASLQSHFVVSYKDAFIDDNGKLLVLVMEFADDGDVYKKIVAS